MIVRSGCGVALVGYKSVKDTAQSLCYQQGVSLMTVSVCHTNKFKCYCNTLLSDVCGDVVCLVFA